MALPTLANAATLDYVNWSLPTFSADAKSGVSSNTLDYVNWSLPIMGTSFSGGGGGGVTTVYVNVSGTWKQSSNVYINVSGTCLLYTSPSPRDRG